MVKVTLISMTNVHEILLNVIMGRNVRLVRRAHPPASNEGLTTSDNVRHNFAVPQQQCCARSVPQQLVCY